MSCLTVEDEHIVMQCALLAFALFYFMSRLFLLNIWIFIMGRREAPAGPFYVMSLVFASALPQNYNLTLVHASVRSCYLCILFHI